MKKPVTFPFLDYGTPERRREMCREEVRLNRRLAPRIYLRVLGIVRSADRYEFAPEDEPGAIEYAVEMRRVQEDRSLAALATSGALEPAHMSAVAKLLSRFHAQAAIAPPNRRTMAALVEPLEENLSTLRAAGEDALSPGVLDAAEAFTRGLLGMRRAQLEARADAGLVRDCHGDLRAEHVVVPAEGDVYVYDCVEFNPSLREIDVAADLAFLVEDLARLEASDLASQLVQGYRDAGGDPGDDTLLSFYASYRAWVRAKVACLRAGELEAGDPQREASRAEARDLFRLGRRFAWRARCPLAVVLCGVSGTGKTTLARELAELGGFAHISSDVTRKRLAGLTPSARAAPQHYSEEFTRRTYAELGVEVRRVLDRGGGAIVDATFHRRAERSTFRDAVEVGPEPIVFVECRAPTEVLVARVRRRETDPEHVSDADVEIVERQLAELESMDEVPERMRAVLATDAPVADLGAEVEQLVDERIWRGGG